MILKPFFGFFGSYVLILMAPSTVVGDGKSLCPSSLPQLLRLQNPLRPLPACGLLTMTKILYSASCTFLSGLDLESISWILPGSQQGKFVWAPQ